MTINSLSTQLTRELEVEKIEKEVQELRQTAISDLQEKASRADTGEE